MEHSDQFDEIPEHLKCPVCFEVPRAKVLQCREGHTLCEKCYSHLSHCPQCRMPFEQEPIRNRAIEKQMDGLSFDCPYKSSGCAQKLDRKSFEGHVQLCYFNFLKFGPFVNACKNLGFNNCKFGMNRGNAAEATQHMEFAHKTYICNRNTKNFFIKSFTPKLHRHGKTAIVLNQEATGHAFLASITNEASGGNHFIVWNAFYWKYPSLNEATEADQGVPYKVELSLIGDGDNSLKWTAPPIDILKCDEDPISRRSPMKMPVDSFLDRATDVLRLEIKILPTST